MLHGFGKDALLCEGNGCQACKDGHEVKQRFSTEVYDFLLKKIMTWEFGSMVAKQLKAIDATLAEEQKKITDVDLRVEATGSMKDKKYQVTPRMTSKPLPDGVGLF